MADNFSFTVDNVQADHTLEAQFDVVPVPVEFHIAASVSGNGTGSIDPAGDVIVQQGGSQTFAIAVADGSVLKALLLDGVEVSPVKV